MLAHLRSAAMQRLARRAADGDREALRGLYRRLHPEVFAYVRRRVAAEADAEDLVAEVFLRLLDRLPTFDPDRGHVRAWTLRIARNLLIDRARRRRPQLSAAQVGSELVAPGADLEALLGSDRRLSALAQAFEELAPDERELLTMRYADGLSHADVAAILGLEPAAARKRCSRLLARLRARLSQEPEIGAAHVG